jgi:protein ImuB
VFFVDASGLERLYPSLQAWAEAVRLELRAAGFRAVVVVGFERFGCYALAKAHPRRGVVVLDERDEEEELARKVPLGRVGLLPSARESLGRLAVRTVGDFVALPATGVRRRFGVEAFFLHQLASGRRSEPLTPAPVVAALKRVVELDDAVSSRENLAFLFSREIVFLLSQLASRGEALRAATVTLTLERRGGDISIAVQPAERTLDKKQLDNLFRLRLEAVELSAGAVRVVVEAEGSKATREQLALFAEKPRRDLGAAARAIARVRAALGNDAVVRARLRDGHLPEAQYAWEPLDRLDPSKPMVGGELRPVIRRIEARPLPLPPRETREPDGWLLGGLEHGPVERVDGPHLLSGGWWRNEVERDYYFAELRSGAVFWVFYDRRRRRWFLHGQVG